MSGMLACQYVTSLLGILESEVAKIEGQGVGKIIGNATNGMGSTMSIPSTIGADFPDIFSKSSGTTIKTDKKPSKILQAAKYLGSSLLMVGSLGSATLSHHGVNTIELGKAISSVKASDIEGLSPSVFKDMEISDLKNINKDNIGYVIKAAKEIPNIKSKSNEEIYDLLDKYKNISKIEKEQQDKAIYNYKVINAENPFAEKGVGVSYNDEFWKNLKQKRGADSFSFHSSNADNKSILIGGIGDEYRLNPSVVRKTPVANFITGAELSKKIKEQDLLSRGYVAALGCNFINSNDSKILSTELNKAVMGFTKYGSLSNMKNSHEFFGTFSKGVVPEIGTIVMRFPESKKINPYFFGKDIPDSSSTVGIKDYLKVNSERDLIKLAYIKQGLSDKDALVLAKTQVGEL